MIKCHTTTCSSNIKRIFVVKIIFSQKTSKSPLIKFLQSKLVPRISSFYNSSQILLAYMFFCASRCQIHVSPEKNFIFLQNLHYFLSKQPSEYIKSTLQLKNHAIINNQDNTSIPHCFEKKKKKNWMTGSKVNNSSTLSIKPVNKYKISQYILYLSR